MPPLPAPGELPRVDLGRWTPAVPLRAVLMSFNVRGSGCDETRKETASTLLVGFLPLNHPTVASHLVLKALIPWKEWSV